ncbi:hypothetical protein [Streptomyces sp. TLI_105]|uniref:hypothetical protein n=1 Tax=Streptomyces sp. TLI_105 TaxID=1881019 RepID=UPI00115FE59D|nr:hypothetical protein [Streptomyces sp. TLI_105]
MLADVDESGALAFAEVVTSTPLDPPAPDGAALVTTSAPRTPEPPAGDRGALAALLPSKGRGNGDPRG